MMRDIFIDNDFIVLNFKNPDKSILEFIKWLYDEEDLAHKAYLIISPKLYTEYVASSSPCASYTNILTIHSVMQAQGRVNSFTNDDIKTFKKEYMPKKVHNKLTCNKKDRDHIPIILLSNRKMAITNDEALLSDLLNFKGFNAKAGRNPNEIEYK